jgi:alkyldihydroxyacetonephosphate synthase
MTEPRLKHFGWGREGEGLTAAEETTALDRYRRLFGVDHFEEKEPPALDEIVLPPPRLLPPPSLGEICSTALYDRAAHTYGKSFRDYARGLAGDYAVAPDLVAYPRDEAEVIAILDWGGGAQAAVVPFASTVVRTRVR